jgi:hypothetical protein
MSSVPLSKLSNGIAPFDNAQVALNCQQENILLQSQLCTD